MQYPVRSAGNRCLARLQEADRDIVTVAYLSDTLDGVRARLSECGKSKEKMYERFPLVALIEPYDFNPGPEWPRATVNLLLLHTSPKDGNAQVRQARVDGILMVLYHELIRAFAKCGLFVCCDPKRDLPHRRKVLKHDVVDSPLANLSGLIGEPVDGLLIENLELKLLNKKLS